MANDGGNVTALLTAYSRGERAALDDLLPLVYDELRTIAARYLRRERPDHTLQPTALVHEAYLRLVRQHSVDWRSRAQFFGLAAQMMRRILVNHAERRHAGKRGSAAATRVALDEIAVEFDARGLDLLALDEALRRLERLDPDKVRVVELKFFGGLTSEEIGAVTGKSTATVNRDWTFARGWLFKELSEKH